MLGKNNLAGMAFPVLHASLDALPFFILDSSFLFYCVSNLALPGENVDVCNNNERHKQNIHN